MAGFGGGGGGLNVQGATVHFYGNANNLNQTINQVQNRLTQFNQLNQTLNNTLSQTFNIRLPPPPKPPDYDWKSMLSSASQANFAFTGLMDRVNAFSGLGPNVSMVWEAFASGGPVLGVVSGVLAGVNVYLNTMVSTFQAGMKALAIGAAGAVAGISFLAYELLNLGGQFEKIQTAYEVFTGSVERGNELFRQVRALAVVTPFRATELHDIAQTLLAMGVSFDQVVPSMSRLGDIASGDEDRLRRLALVFGQVLSEGRLSGRRMLQLATLGIGAEDIGATLGKSASQIKQMSKDGELGANALIETVNRLTEAGGRFYGMNVRQATTLRGQWSNLIDVLQDLGGQLGKTLIQRYDLGGLVGRAGALVYESRDQITSGITSLFDGLMVAGEQVLKFLTTGFDAAAATINAAFGNVSKDPLQAIRDITVIILKDVISAADAMTQAFLTSSRVIINVIVKPLLTVLDVLSAIGRMGSYIDSVMPWGAGGEQRAEADATRGRFSKMVEDVNRLATAIDNAAVRGQQGFRGMFDEWNRGFAKVTSRDKFGTTSAETLGAFRYVNPRDVSDIRMTRDAMFSSGGGGDFSDVLVVKYDEMVRDTNEKLKGLNVNLRPPDFELARSLGDTQKPMLELWAKNAGTDLKAALGRQFESFMPSPLLTGAIKSAGPTAGGLTDYIFNQNKAEAERQSQLLLNEFQQRFDANPIALKFEILPEAQKVADALNKTISQGTDSALGKFKHEMELINLAFSAGVIGQEEYELGAANAFQDLQKAVKPKGETHTAGAAAFGTQQAADAIAKAQGGAQDTLESVLDTVKRANQLAEEAKIDRRATTAEIEKLNRKGVVVVPGEVAP